MNSGSETSDLSSEITNLVNLSDVRQVDADLMQRVASRDEEAFAIAYRMHGDACFGLARRVLHNKP